MTVPARVVLSNFHLTHYIVSNPTITTSRGGGRGSESDAFNVSQLSFQLWQRTANASMLGNFFTEKFQIERN